jgi:hydroxymethylbilane synthase
MNRFILGTRGSALALAQAELTGAALRREAPELTIEQKIFVTRGDLKLDLSFIRASEAGGKGLFTRELEEALLAGTIDVAVHSLKDLPGHNPLGLEITAVLPRASTADVMIAREAESLDALPLGSVLGTSSVRRARQLGWLRPDLVIEEWRGNVQTRLRKLGESERVGGIILAQAGLERLGYDLSSGRLEYGAWNFRVVSLGGVMLPAIGQGAIALQSRSNRAEVTALLEKINHRETHLAIRAERELQRLLAGDCGMPVGVRTTIDGERLHLRVVLFGEENSAPQEVEGEGSVDDPEAVAAGIFKRLA